MNIDQCYHENDIIAQAISVNHAQIIIYNYIHIYLVLPIFSLTYQLQQGAVNLEVCTLLSIVKVLLFRFIVYVILHNYLFE